MMTTEYHGASSSVIDAAPDAVFAAVTSVDRLPEWNDRIARVLQRPDVPLAEGVEWVVQMAVPPARWASRSRVVRCDAEARTFEYVSRSDDDNPGWAEWRWALSPTAAGGTEVRVEWTGHARTFWRKLLLSKWRRSGLHHEVPASLDALAAHLDATG